VVLLQFLRAPPMSLSTEGYVAAALLPFLYNEIPDLIVRRWYWMHSKTPIPPEIAAQAVKEGNTVPYLALIVLSVSLGALIRSAEIPTFAIGVTLNDWPMSLFIGVLAGSGWLALYMWVIQRTRPSREQIERHFILQRSLWYWFPLAVLAPFVEELWRGFCLVALAGQGTVVAVAVTATACGWGHAQSRGRVISAVLFGLYVAGLFLWTRSLLVTIPAHLIVNLGTLGLIHAVHRRSPPSRTATGP
jgi:membrane protease YdiL (CAAX protease family)